ncbi:hypothetical protein H9Q13_16475 [Pontibacter sp. JH31]|uniref:Uncharacterized protein n=1 Tax=Pontibacter aquaedesilientis TaxID=2766980 RepID=A0ABR7XMX5_9BACT|nr:hypothetical protein [Pontibacter aquaedesilientis]MBD1398771.1 hypothetical protein [Pontibacter aquaedesilientis]
MKKFYSLATALLLVAGTFTSCTKDLDEVGPMSASTEQAAKAGTVNANQKVDGGLMLSISTATPTVGENVTITASFRENVTAGTLRIEQLQPDNTWAIVKTSSLSSTVKSISHDFTSNVVGSYTFRGFYTPTGGANFMQAQTAGSTVTFISNCTGANLTANLVYATPVAGGMTEYKVAFTLTSCTAYSNVKLQGGISATISGDVVAMSADQVPGAVKYNTRNAVVNWAGLNLTEGYSNTFYVTFRMADSNKVNPIGNWTAKAGDMLIAEATL